MDYQEELVVKRSEWNRGTGCGKLYDGECRCILGHYLAKHGVKDISMKDIHSPFKLFDEIEYIDTPIELVAESYDDEYDYEWHDTEWTDTTVCINDDAKITDEDREQQLILQFKSERCKLTFID